MLTALKVHLMLVRGMLISSQHLTLCRCLLERLNEQLRRTHPVGSYYLDGRRYRVLYGYLVFLGQCISGIECIGDETGGNRTREVNATLNEARHGPPLD